MKQIAKLNDLCLTVDHIVNFVSRTSLNCFVFFYFLFVAFDFLFVYFLIFYLHEGNDSVILNIFNIPGVVRTSVLVGQHSSLRQ